LSLIITLFNCCGLCCCCCCYLCIFII